MNKSRRQVDFVDGSTLTMADVPGLVEGAHRGWGTEPSRAAGPQQKTAKTGGISGGIVGFDVIYSIL